MENLVDYAIYLLFCLFEKHKDRDPFQSLSEMDQLYDAYTIERSADIMDRCEICFVKEHQLCEPIYFPLYLNKSYVRKYVKSIEMARADAIDCGLFGVVDEKMYRRLSIVFVPDPANPETQLKYTAVRRIDGKRDYNSMAIVTYSGAYYEKERRIIGGYVY